MIFPYLGIFEYINNLNFFFNFKLISSEEIIVIFLFYNFIKILIFGSVLELIWPTQFFNKRHNNVSNFRFRSFTETFLKLKNNNLFYNIFNKAVINYYFLKN